MENERRDVAGAELSVSSVQDARNVVCQKVASLAKMATLNLVISAERSFGDLSKSKQ